MAHVFGGFSRIVDRFPERVAVEVCHRTGVERITYRGLRELAERVAGVLSGLGVHPGDRCAILADNDIRWCAAYLGILRLGAVVVPLDTAYRASQLQVLLRDCRATLLFASARHAALAREAAAGMARAPVVMLLAGSAPGVLGLDDALAAGGREAPPCEATWRDPAVLAYTSGTTDDPKGVVLTHGNLLAEQHGALSAVRVDEHDAILGILPLFHVLAQASNLFLPFAAGARVVHLATLDTAEMMRAFREREITSFCVVPQFYYLLHRRILERVASAGAPARAAFRLMIALNYRLRAWAGVNLGRRLFAKAHEALGGRMRLLLCGGSRFDPKVGRDLYAMGFNILQVYGLTECAGAATVTRPGDPHLDTVGQPIDGVEIRIDGRGRAAGDAGGEDGEILLRGPIVMAGYHGRSDLTASTLEDGWLRTGDLGHLDGAGRLVITGRKKEIIVLASGKNIYPEEIEAHYAQSPFIRELCVLGLSDPHEPAAERLHALVVPDQDVMRERRIVNFREILRFEIESLSLSLPGHKRLLGFDVWLEDLPRTTTKKLKRHEIARLFRERQAQGSRPDPPAEWRDSDRAWASDPAASRVLDTIRAAAGRHAAAVAPDASLELDLGFDSMGRIEVLSRIEQDLGVTVPDEVAQRVLTVRQLVDEVRPFVTDARSAAPADGADPWARLLESDGANPDVGPILERRPLATFAVYAAARAAHALARALLGLRVAGTANLPPSGPFVISPNHQSYLDPVLLVGSLAFRTFRRLFFVGASEYFATPWRRRLARLAHIVPIDPDANLVRALRAGVAGLRHGLVLMLFPEGERSPDGSPRRFKKGAAIAALQTRVPIVPVAIHGVSEIWPRGGAFRWGSLLPWRRTRCVIRFGEPIPPGGAEADGPGRYDAHTASLRHAVVGMWEQLDAQRTSS